MWDPDKVPKAIAAALRRGPASVSVYPFAPASFNPPALVVSRPDSIELSAQAFSVDQVNIAVIAFGPIDGDGTVGRLLADARSLLEDDRSLGGHVQTLRAVRYRNWRAMNVSGADLLAADLLLEVWA